MSNLPFEDCPPQLDRVGPYDEKHLKDYITLLDADEQGADWREVVSYVFGLDADKEPERAKRVHESHLARARWMTEKGHRHLLETRMQYVGCAFASKRKSVIAQFRRVFYRR